MNPFPAKTEADLSYALVKAAFEEIPLAGSALVAVMEHWFIAPIERRREEWLAHLASAVDEIKSRVDGLTIETLSENDAFLSTVFNATHIALRSHQREKLEALRRAVIHAALPNAPSEDKQRIFVRLIDELTPTHIRALALARPRGWNSYERRVHLGMPDLDESFIRAVVRELQVRGLLWMESDTHFPGKPNSVGSAPPLTDEFLSFIGVPPHKYS